MLKKFYHLVLLFAVIIMNLPVNAQDSLQNKRPEMADALRASGKIYVVVAVLVTILCGLFLYLFRLERKISKLEKTGRND